MKRIVCCFICLCVLCFSLHFNADAVGTSAKAAIVINADTNEIIYEHNANHKLPMASTTKIMTGLLLCEYGNLQREITVTAEMLKVEGSSMGLLAGDRVTLHDLLYGLMLASGNDAANVVAFTLGGTVNGFVKQMNIKARELGLKNTNFVTPSGLDADEHYTTAYDLAVLTSFALKNEEFAKAVSSKSAVLNYGNPPYRRTLTNHNKLLKSNDNVVGVKTGFTKKSGRCLVSAAKENGKTVVAVTLSDPDDWNDHTSLLEYGLNSIKTQIIEPPQTKFQIPVIGSENETLNIEIAPFEANVTSDDNLSCTVNLPQFVYAPINKGEQVGSVVYIKGDEVIHTSLILAEKEIKSTEIKKDFLESVIYNIKEIFKNIWEK